MLVQGIANRLRTRYKAKGRCLELDAADLIETLTTRVQALEQELGVTNTLFAAEQNRADKLEQERERVRQELATALDDWRNKGAPLFETMMTLHEIAKDLSLPPAGEREET